MDARRELLRAAFLVAVALVTPITAICQGLDDDFLNSAVLIKFRADANHLSFGSGFLIFHQVACDSKRNRCDYHLFLVTNKHVIPREHGSSSRDISIRTAFRKPDGGVEVRDIPIPILNQNAIYVSEVTAHPDPSIDVVVIDVTNALSAAHAEFFARAAETRKTLLTSLLVSRDKLKAAGIGIGTEIYLLGYPSGIYDQENVSPILRIGIISTEPTRDFFFNSELRTRVPDLPPKVPGFLIDGNVFPGSSGSMVVRRTNLSPGYNPGGELSMPHILGIVSMSVPIEDIWGPERMGLGVVFGADTIRETIEIAVSRMSATRQ